MKLGRRIIPRLFAPGDVLPEVPPASTAPKPHVRQGIYLIPALFTLGNMALGFFAIVKTMAGEIGTAATAILVGHVLDIFDGRVARWTKTTSRFGVELDSLADWMTFIIAPAFIMYEMVLKHNRLWGFPIALLFVICGALRLARFNFRAHMGDTKMSHFSGLPTPAAGGMLAIFALLYDILEADKPVRTLRVVMNQMPVFYQLVPLIMFGLSMLMVSDVRYTSFKQVNLLRPRTMRALTLTLMTLLMVYVYPQNTIFIFYLSYIVWGLLDTFLGRSRRGKVEPKVGYQQDNYGK